MWREFFEKLPANREQILEQLAKMCRTLDWMGVERDDRRPVLRLGHAESAARFAEWVDGEMELESSDLPDQ